MERKAPKKVDRKRFVRYKEGAEMYSMCQSKFEDMAKDAGAIYKLNKLVLVNCDIFELFLVANDVIRQKQQQLLCKDLVCRVILHVDDAGLVCDAFSVWKANLYLMLFWSQTGHFLH